MFRYRLRELLTEKEHALNRRIPLNEVSQATGISVQVLSSFTAPGRPVVTNSAFIEALCRYFQCTTDRLLTFDPPIETQAPTHIDQLYPNRRPARGG